MVVDVKDQSELRMVHLIPGFVWCERHETVHSAVSVSSEYAARRCGRENWREIGVVADLPL